MAHEAKDAHLQEVALESTTAFEGRFLKVKRDIVALPDGTQTYREYIIHPGAVMLIPLLDDGRVVMERQWRHPHGRAFLEFPAGKIDHGESPRATAERELREETGYSAARLDFLCTIHNAISYSDEHIDLYLASGLSEGAASLDEGELLDVLTVDPEELMDAVRKGEITDVKTIIGAFWLEKIRHGQWTVGES